MLPQEIIRKKRNKEILNPTEINDFINGITDGSIMDSQIAAMTMAIFLNGMTPTETTNLTLSMRDSGDTLNWNDIDAPIVDKHSSGGVGDKVSLMLAPMLAACGAYVPMISGRGLGHTGGTLDKFDSIPGYQTNPDNTLFKNTVKQVGCAIIGQTGNLAPADKKIYAIRDICATVESIELITASILSKKLAAGLQYLVMDLKCGNGAFMDNINNARALASSIVRVANLAGTKTTALLTDMNQVLGHNVGNALEMQEAVEYLQGKNIDSRLHKVTLDLCSELLINSKLASNYNDAIQKLQKSLDSGKALEIFAKMVSSLGGPNDFCEHYDKYLEHTPIIQPVYAPHEGYVNTMQTRNIGLALIELKGGRTRSDQKLDYATGFSNFCQIGDYVDNQVPLCFIHARTEDDFELAKQNILNNITISTDKPSTSPTIIEKIGD